MPTLDNTGTNLTGSHELTQRTGTIIKFDTDAKYVEKDIWFTVNAQAATPTFDGGDLSGEATATYTNATTDTTNTSGVSVVASATASRTAVLYNGAVNGWVTKANDAATEITAITDQALTSETKYITGVTINTSKNFNITIPNGSTTPTLTLNFSVDSNGNTTVT